MGRGPTAWFDGIITSCMSEGTVPVIQNSADSEEVRAMLRPWEMHMFSHPSWFLCQILLPSAVHLEERLTVSQSVS